MGHTPQVFFPSCPEGNDARGGRRCLKALGIVEFDFCRLLQAHLPCKRKAECTLCFEKQQGSHRRAGEKFCNKF